MDYTICPRCGNRPKPNTDPEEYWDVTPITDASGVHYICNNPKCGNNYIYEDDSLNPDPHPADPGERTQFRVVKDEKVRFPFNQIFIGRETSEFFRKEYVG